MEACCNEVSNVVCVGFVGMMMLCRSLAFIGMMEKLVTMLCTPHQ